jgi:hypothetical protein
LQALIQPRQQLIRDIKPGGPLPMLGRQFLGDHVRKYDDALGVAVADFGGDTVCPRSQRVQFFGGQLIQIRVGAVPMETLPVCSERAEGRSQHACNEQPFKRTAKHHSNCSATRGRTEQDGHCGPHSRDNRGVAMTGRATLVPITLID